MAEAYATDADVLAAWPGLAALPAEERAALVADANAAVRDHCGRDLLLAARTERYSGRNRGRIWLAVRPIVEVSAVSIDGIGELSYDDGEGWAWDPETGALYRGPARTDPRHAPWFPFGTRNVEVAYTAGYDPVPPPVRRAAVLTARRLHDQGRQSGVYKSESIGDYSYTLADGQPVVSGFAASLLRRYRETWA